MALHIASQNDHCGVVRMTAIYVACHQGHDEIVRVLLAAKATGISHNMLFTLFSSMYSRDGPLFGQPVSMVTTNVWSS